MKGLWIVGITTTAVLTLSIGSLLLLEKSGRELTAYLVAAETATNEEAWAEAAQAMEEAFTYWERCQRYWSSLANHQELDAIRQAFARADAFINNQEKAAAVAELAVCKLLVEHIPQKERPTWGNVL